MAIESRLEESIGAWGAEYTDPMSTPLSWLQSEIYQRMLEKLEPIKVMPNEILLQPDFPGLGLRQLVKRFPRAQIDTVADSHLSLHQQMRLRMQRLFRGLLNRGTLLHQNPSSRENHYGLMISCLELQHYERPQDWIEIAHRQIREDGLLCFSYLGPDTGKELRISPQASPYLKNLPGALDMHDIGDALVQKGFSDPVMDMEYLYLEYESVTTHLRDALAIGLVQSNTPVDALSNALQGKKMTLEIVYGHAWVLGKNLSKSDGKTAYIRPDAIKRK